MAARHRLLLRLFCTLVASITMSLSLRIKHGTLRSFRPSMNMYRPSKHRSTMHMSTKPSFINEMESKYFDFKRLEKDLYGWWEKEGYFQPSNNLGSSDGKKKKPFVVPMPPPNVTGYLHMGHAMFVALQDLMIRFQRMRGRETLYLPGTDHAGIATQLLVEKSLSKEGISRQSIGREKFLEKVWAWKEEKGGYIIGQMKRLGASADWSREKFTLDEDMSSSVVEAFVSLHERGLIYRGEYMVNWSPSLQTAVSDLEVEYSEETGKLYYFKYFLEDGSGHLPVATTRPETILGDTAVCVNPSDPRYQSYIGKRVKVPFVDPPRYIQIYGDDYVDPEFGTGVLKVTPGHDINDYELAKRLNGASIINIMNKDGSINHIGGEMFQGLDRFVCREKLWAEMEKLDMTIKVESHTQRVPRSQRGGEVIEPMVSKQWFLKMDNMASRAVQAAKNKDITFVPDRFEKIWYNWLENIHDWCISRQLWWGHRIPVFYVTKGSSSDDEKDYVVARSYEEAMKIATEKFGSDIKIRQDDDVLDTWFSSGLWPFATVGWPNSKISDPSSDFSKFYPASVMETGYDILFFWVARMVMMGLEFTDQVPFHTIYLHGLVRDAQGQKMSKTKGNVIDPIDTIDQYGCDALRFSLVTGSTPGQDIPLSMEKVESSRNFVNKLWNVGKYIQNALSSLTNEEKLGLAVSNAMNQEALSNLPLAERYIVSRVHELANEVTAAMERYDYGDATRRLYEFIWDDFADWYVEASKTRMRNPAVALMARQTLVYVWDTAMRVLHPFMPFISETLWQCLPHRGESLMVSQWPVELIEGDTTGSTNLFVSNGDIKAFQSIQALIRSVRNARAEYKVEGGKAIAATIKVTNAPLYEQILNERAVISLLGRVDDKNLDITNEYTLRPDDRSSVHLIVEDGLEVFLPLSTLIDVDKETQRLRKQEEKLKKDVMALESRISSPGFVEKAPASMVAEVRANLQEKKEQLNMIEKSLASLIKT